MSTVPPIENHGTVTLNRDATLTEWYEQRATKEQRSKAHLIREALREYARRRGYQTVIKKEAVV